MSDVSYLSFPTSRCLYISICDQIWRNPASTHTKSNLQFYQKWTASSMHLNSPCTLYFLGGWQVCILLQIFLTLWKPRVDNWCHSEAMALLELCVMNRDFTGSLPAVISLKLEWFVCIEEPQRAITWSLDSIHLPPPFNAPIN